MGDKETPKKLFQCDLGHVCRLYCSETGRFQNIFSKPGFCRRFQFLEDVVPVHIKHRFTSEMAQRSTVILLPILNADEKKYDDCVVAILRAYENWIYKVYKKAGSLNQVEGLHLPSSSAQQQPATDPQIPSNSVR